MMRSSTPKNQEAELTPDEILEEFPQLVQVYQWRKETPGMMARKGALIGYYSPAAKNYFIKRWSVLAFIKLANENMTRRIIDLSGPD